MNPIIGSRGLRARSAVFFDRDGVLNEDDGYVHQVANFRWIEGAQEAVRLANELNHLVIVVTNQSGIARGFYTEEDVAHLHNWMQQELSRRGARIDAFYYCPYHPEAKIERYRVADHPDRKPNPGMILKAMRDFNIDPSRSLIVGNEQTDLEAGRRAGLRGYLFQGGSLADAVRLALRAVGA